ncbi:hypothetical protein DXG03_006359 [Asterophora parasitica]|uniref:Uncharacterized protein n=1 Tax=Asterophora parasitica TaxID=117018 RepID=A0A9P7FYS3_9AGAR|nr:hypothetical protein DXG03_006359 [Asterophora parasitica]
MDLAEPEVVASAVAEVLAEAPHLNVLCIDKFVQDMCVAEPRLGEILTSCNHLTDLTLTDVGVDSLHSFSGLRGLRQLTLVAYGAMNQVIWDNYLHIPEDSSVGTLIFDSSSTLESISLIGFSLKSLFNDPTISFPKVHSIHYLRCEANLEDQERAFPAMRNVHADPMPFSETTLSSFAPFWFDLESIGADLSFICGFRNCRTLRRVAIMDHLLGPLSLDARLLLNQLASKNHLVSLSLTVPDPTSVVLESILKEAYELVFLEIVLVPQESLAEAVTVRAMLTVPVAIRQPSPSLATTTVLSALSTFLARAFALLFHSNCTSRPPLGGRRGEGTSGRLPFATDTAEAGESAAKRLAQAREWPKVY